MWIARRLEATLFSLDDYYRDLAHLPKSEREKTNFDDPAMFDWRLLEQDIAALGRGETISKPLYDFENHIRRTHRETVTPCRFVIVEGLFALHDPALRRLYGTSVYVHLDDDVCFARRMERDIRERGRSRESVLAQYEATVRPMCEKYVRPTRAHASVVVRGDDPLAQSAEAVMAHLRAIA